MNGAAGSDEHSWQLLCERIMGGGPITEWSEALLVKRDTQIKTEDPRDKELSFVHFLRLPCRVE